MSNFTTSLIKAADDGNLENFQTQPSTTGLQAPEEEEETAGMPVVNQEVLEAVSLVNSEIETSKYIEGTAASVFTELSTGMSLQYAFNQRRKIGQYILSKYRPAMKFLRGASHVSKVGIVAPEAGSTITGTLGLIGAEALIWGGSNLLGQAVRKSYGIQEEMSAGEAIAASVFGTTFVFDKVNKAVFGLGVNKTVFGLGRPAIGKETWKGRNLLIRAKNGQLVKTFVSGAALGLAESALRQQVQLLLNERDNWDNYDALLSAGIGGTMNAGLNTLFTAWSKTGSWGRGQAKKAVTNAKTVLGKQKAELTSQIKEEKSVPRVSILSGGARSVGEIANRNKELLKQIRDIEHAEEVIDDSIASIIEASKAVSAREKKPVPLKKDVIDDAPLGSVQKLSEELDALEKLDGGPEVIKSVARIDEMSDLRIQQMVKAEKGDTGLLQNIIERKRKLIKKYGVEVSNYRAEEAQTMANSPVFQTKEFKDFMTRNGVKSQTLKDDGTPQIFFHGTRSTGFTEFVPDSKGLIFVSNDPQFAMAYPQRAKALQTPEAVKERIKAARTKEGYDETTEYAPFGSEIEYRAGAGVNVLPVAVYAKKIFDVRNKETAEEAFDYFSKQKAEDIFVTEQYMLDLKNGEVTSAPVVAKYGNTPPSYEDALREMIDSGNFLLFETNEFVDFLKGKGYDSMRVSENPTSGAADFATLAVFDGNQIKSASANRGTFDESANFLASAPQREMFLASKAGNAEELEALRTDYKDFLKKTESTEGEGVPLMDVINILKVESSAALKKTDLSPNLRKVHQDFKLHAEAIEALAKKSPLTQEARFVTDYDIENFPEGLASKGMAEFQGARELEAVSAELSRGGFANRVKSDVPLQELDKKIADAFDKTDKNKTLTQIVSEKLNKEELETGDFAIIKDRNTDSEVRIEVLETFYGQKTVDVSFSEYPQWDIPLMQRQSAKDIIEKSRQQFKEMGLTSGGMQAQEALKIPERTYTGLKGLSKVDGLRHIFFHEVGHRLTQPLSRAGGTSMSKLIKSKPNNRNPLQRKDEIVKHVEDNKNLYDEILDLKRTKQDKLTNESKDAVIQYAQGINNIDALHKVIQTKLGDASLDITEIRYGLSNPTELAAEAMSNPLMQKALSDIKIDDALRKELTDLGYTFFGDQKPTNLFRVLLENLLKIIGLKPNDVKNSTLERMFIDVEKVSDVTTLGQRAVTRKGKSGSFQKYDPTIPSGHGSSPTPNSGDDELNALIKRWESINSDNVTTEGVKAHRDAERFNERVHRRLGENLVALSKNGDDIQAVSNALDAVVLLRKLNKKFLDLSKTAGGRLVQGSRKDSNKYSWEAKYSHRAAKEDEALNKLENSLRERLDGGEEDDLSKLMKNYLGVQKDVNKQDKAQGKKKPVKEQTPEQIAKKEAKEKNTLKKKLDRLQKRFGDDSKLKPKDKPKKKKADAEIADLKARIRFHEANERDAIKLTERLKERERLLVLETGPLGAQRAAVSKKPKGPTKTPGRLEKVEADIAFLKKNMRDRIKEIDKAAEDMSRVTEAVDLHAKEISKLDDELEKLRKQFGDTEGLDARAEAKEGAPKPEKSPDIAEREAKIKFHKEAQAEALLLAKKIKERDRLLEVETGPLGGQRAEVTKPTKTSKKVDGEVETLNEQINFLRANMRNRIKEIDKAAEEMTPEFQAEKIRKAHETKVSRLEKELNQRRERFGDLEKARKESGMPKLQDDPKIKELEDRIKFYKEAEAEALKVVKLEQELARVAAMEGRGLMGEMRAETTAKPEGPTKPSRSADLREQINQSKARMKKRVADIDKAQAEINADKQRMEIYGNYREHFDASLNKEGITLFTQGINSIQLARQLALINQLPSVFAGVGTNLLAGFKQFFRPVGGFLSNVVENRTGVKLAVRFAQADFFGAMRMLTDLKGLPEAVKRTFNENLGATTRTLGKFSDEVSQTTIPRGEDALIAKAWNDSKRQAEAVENVGNVFGRFINSRNMWHVLSLGVRGIQSVDEVFKRQIIKGRLWSEASKNGIRAFPDDAVKAEKYAVELYESAWKDNDGLAVLDDVSNFYDEINQVNEELLFASNVDRVEDMYEPISEAVIRSLNKFSDARSSESEQLVGNLIRTLMPYIGVPIRGAYRLGHYSLPFVAKATGNPYNRKLKAFTDKLEAAEADVRIEKDPERIKALEDAISELREKVETASIRRAKYNNETMTDLLVGTSLFGIGYLMAQDGGTTGGLSWMTDDQKEKNKLKPYDALGVNYVANMPWSGPIALGADMAIWRAMKEAEDDTGLPILQKDQTLPMVMRSSLTTLLAEQPLSAGYKVGKEIATGELEPAIAKLLSSYIPIPAQVRKITQTVTSDGTVDDLRGATFYERIAYHTLGVGPSNKKTDLLGEPLESPRTFFTQNITRLAPQKEVVRTELDNVLATDNYQQVSGKPTTLATGIKLTDWRNEDGLTLEYVFALRLRKTRRNNKSISQAVNALIKSSLFKRRYEKAPVLMSDGKYQNEGLKMLNDKLNDYYNRTKTEILKDKRLMSSFIDEDNRNLLELYEQTGKKIDTGGAPQSVLQLLND